MVLRNNADKKEPGTSFEAGRSPRARAPGRRKVLSGSSETVLDALRRSQKLPEAPRSSQEFEKSKFSCFQRSQGGPWEGAIRSGPPTPLRLEPLGRGRGGVCLLVTGRQVTARQPLHALRPEASADYCTLRQII